MEAQLDINAYYFLLSERLGFRHWNENDLELALGLWGDFEVTKLIDARGRLTSSQIHERLMQEICFEEAYSVQYWPIFLLLNGDHVGCCGLRPYDIEKKIYEVGFHIRSIYWGFGYATEAAQAVMQYAFDSLNASALFAGHNPNNKTSRYLLEKLGFHYTHDELYPPTGLYHPSYLMKSEEYR